GRGSPVNQVRVADAVLFQSGAAGDVIKFHVNSSSLKIVCRSKLPRIAAGRGIANPGEEQKTRWPRVGQKKPRRWAPGLFHFYGYDLISRCSRRPRGSG